MVSGAIMSLLRLSGFEPFLASSKERRRWIDHHTLAGKMIGECVALGTLARKSTHRRCLGDRCLRRKLVFRGAWLDHRVKEGLLEVAWDDAGAEFGYRDPRGGRALLELLPVPSWHELQFRR